MTDQTARRVLADHVRMYDSFRERDVCICDKWTDFDTDEDFTDHVLAAFAAARVAVIPLPAPDDDQGDGIAFWTDQEVGAADGMVVTRFDPGNDAIYFCPSEAVKLASTLLAAAAAAEEQQ